MPKQTQAKTPTKLEQAAENFAAARAEADRLRAELAQAEANVEKIRGDLQTATADAERANSALLLVALEQS